MTIGAIEATRTILVTDDPPARISTAASSDDALASTKELTDPNREGWQQVIDQKLVEWGRDPDGIAEIDLIPPSHNALRVANHLAMTCRDKGIIPPMRVVPNGGGGVVFERWHGQVTQSLEIHDDGSVESIEFHNHRVVRCEKIV